MLLISVALALLTYSQTVYDDLPGQTFFNFSISHDGRLEAKIRGGNYYGEGDPYLEVYRNFIELNRDTRTLMIAFAVAELFFNDNSHIMTVAIPSGATVTGPPIDATFPKPHWFNDNMILWYDAKEKAQVLIYQQGCYSCLEAYGYDDWTTNHSYDALNQSIFKTMSWDDGQSWHGVVELLQGKVLDPHVQYQIIPGLETDEDGFSKEVLIPVHHLDESIEDNNYQMLWRTNRAIDPDDGSWRYVNMTDAKDNDHLGGHIQATVIRPHGDERLVAFLRDRHGHWLHRTTSSDDGKTWKIQIPTSLPNPDLMSQAVVLHNGHIMLFHNPQQSYGNWPPADRDDNSHMLAVSVSKNVGLSWMAERMLEYANDGKSLYPVALQDPLCDNIYLSWSAAINMQGPGINCQAVLNTGGTKTEYQACLNKSVTMMFVKFTVLHETWVLDNHNWELDYNGCNWEIAPTLQDRIKERKDAYVEGAKKRFFSVNLNTVSASGRNVDLTVYIVVLAFTLSMLVCWTLAMFCYTVENGCITCCCSLFDQYAANYPYYTGSMRTV